MECRIATEGHPLDVRQKGQYAVHSHHIFPSSRLHGEGGYDNANHLHKKIVNEIGNRAFLTGETNWSLSDDRPAEYMPEIQGNYAGALEKQLILASSDLWKIENYEEFLKRRRKLIADSFNYLMKEVLAETEPTKPLNVAEIIASSESATIEFKSSLRWDVGEKRVNKDLQKVMAKTVGGFMNAEGGILLIGVADDGEVLGIQDDINSTGRKDLDGFQQTLIQTFSNYLGESVAANLDVSFDAIDGKTLCAVKVGSSRHPTYFSGGKGTDFYIRFGSSTRPLDVEESQKYIGEKWG